jgi:hypothetical protein
MDPLVQVAVDVPEIGDQRRKNWAKVVQSVDTDKSSGWAYHGDFVATGGIQDIDAPSVLLVYGERGSRVNPQIEARAYLVNTDGTLSLRASASGRTWARTLRDPIEDMLAADSPLPPQAREWGPELMAYTDEALRQELERRQIG